MQPLDFLRLEPKQLRRLVADMRGQGWNFRCYPGLSRRKKRCGTCDSPLGSYEWVFRREATTDAGNSWRVAYCCVDCALKYYNVRSTESIDTQECLALSIYN